MKPFLLLISSFVFIHSAAAIAIAMPSDRKLQLDTQESANVLLDSIVRLPGVDESKIKIIQKKPLSEDRLMVTADVTTRDSCIKAKRSLLNCPETMQLELLFRFKGGNWEVTEQKITSINGINVSKQKQSEAAMERGDIAEGVKLMKESMSREMYQARLPMVRAMITELLQTNQQSINIAKNCVSSAKVATNSRSTLRETKGFTLVRCEEMLRTASDKASFNQQLLTALR